MEEEVEEVEQFRGLHRDIYNVTVLVTLKFLSCHLWLLCLLNAHMQCFKRY